MRKLAVILIIVAIAVIVGANWYINSLPAPPAPNEADGTTLRSTQSGDVVGFIDASGARAWLGVPFARPPVGRCAGRRRSRRRQPTASSRRWRLGRCARNCRRS